MKTRLKQGFTLIELLVVITIIAILASLALPAFNGIQERGNITKGINNCRQIITSLKIYASDNNGAYPTAADDTQATGTGTGTGAGGKSNDAFRKLFTEGVLTTESIFGCPASPANPDGNIGDKSSGYKDALKSKENHWAMTASLSDSSPASYPVVFENATDATWNPKWEVASVSQAKKGRVWSGPKIIIGMNDASVSAVKLDSTTGKVKAQGTGKNIFEVSDPSSSGGGGTATAPTIMDADL